MNADSPLRVVPALVAYHSADWIQVAIASYLEHFPEDRILVIDNNPRRGEPGWDPDCERERSWLRAHPRVDHAIDTLAACSDDGVRIHGLGVDLAVQWCRDRGVDVLVHFEPDCVITGRRWRENLLRAIECGSWMAARAPACVRPDPSDPLGLANRSTPHHILQLRAGAGLSSSALRGAARCRGAPGGGGTCGRVALVAAVLGHRPEGLVRSGGARRRQPGRGAGLPPLLERLRGPPPRPDRPDRPPSRTRALVPRVGLRRSHPGGSSDVPTGSRRTPRDPTSPAAACSRNGSGRRARRSARFRVPPARPAPPRSRPPRTIGTRSWRASWSAPASTSWNEAARQAAPSHAPAS